MSLTGKRVDELTALTTPLHDDLFYIMHDPSDTKVHHKIAIGSLRDYINVKDYGATGDGVTDDTDAIQAAIDVMDKGDVLCFPPGVYRITDTLHFGRWNIDESDNVKGFLYGKGGCTIRGSSDLSAGGESFIVWDGGSQPGTTVVTITDSVGDYDIVTDAKPMISILNSRHVRFEHLRLAGNDEAYCGIEMNGMCDRASFHNVHAGGCRIGVRIGVGWNLETAAPYWSYVASPYYRANYTDYIAVGGYSLAQIDLHQCRFEGNHIGFSCESTQAVGVTLRNCSWTLNTHSECLVRGPRMTFMGTSFTSKTTLYDIYHATSTFVGTFIEHHTESTPSQYGIRSLTTSSVGPSLTFINSRYINSIRIACGGGKISSLGSTLGEIIRSADFERDFDVSLINSSVENISLVTSSFSERIRINAQNVVVTGGGNLLTGAGANECQQWITGIQPASAYAVEVRTVVTGNIRRMEIRSDSTSGNQFVLGGATNRDQGLEFGYDSDNDIGRVQAILQGVGRRPLHLNPDGGANSEIVFGGVAQLPSLADASAPNSSLYYSTTASKLVWKDAAGSVHELY